MKIKPFFLAVACAVGLTPFFASASLTMTFKNQSEFPDEEVFIWVVGQPGYNITKGGTNDAVNLRTAYPLTAVPKGLVINRVYGGRVYVSFGKGLQTPTDNPERDPGVLPGDIGYNIRHDFMELTFDGQPGNVADLTSMDQFGITLSLQLKANGVPMTGPGSFAGWKGNDDKKVISSLANYVNPAGSNIVTAGGKFIRVKGATKFPTLYHNTKGNPQSMYAYLDAIKASGKTLTIRGAFNPSNQYHFHAKIDPTGNYVLTKQPEGCTGPVPDKITIPATYTLGGVTVPLAEAIYLSNPHYYLNDDDKTLVPTQNDASGAAARDLFAALNLGYVNSTHIVTPNDLATPPGVDPNTLIGKAVGDLDTAQMHYLKIAFSDVNPSFYNIYANAVRVLSDSYGYAYSDWNEHLSKVTVLIAAPQNGVRPDEIEVQISGSRNPIEGMSNISPEEIAP